MFPAIRRRMDVGIRLDSSLLDSAVADISGPIAIATLGYLRFDQAFVLCWRQTRAVATVPSIVVTARVAHRAQPADAGAHRLAVDNSTCAIRRTGRCRSEFRSWSCRITSRRTQASHSCGAIEKIFCSPLIVNLSGMIRLFRRGEA